MTRGFGLNGLIKSSCFGAVVSISCSEGFDVKESIEEALVGALTDLFPLSMMNDCARFRVPR